MKQFSFFCSLCFLLALWICCPAEIINGDTLKYNSALQKNLKYDVILLGGQSNMLGVGLVSELEDKYLPDNITYLNYGLCSRQLRHPDWFGPEVGLSRVLAEKFPTRNFLLVKYAIGGSSLYDWAPDYEPEKAKITSHPEFGNMFGHYFSIIDSLSGLYELNVAAILWMQGEADSKKYETAKEYYSNFNKLIRAFRRKTDNPELPFIFGEVNPATDRFPFVKIVQAAQLKAAKKIKFVYLIKTGDISKKADKVHYDSSGQLILGERFGNCLIRLNK